jgi:hypothetical protein
MQPPRSYIAALLVITVTVSTGLIFLIFRPNPALNSPQSVVAQYVESSREGRFLNAAELTSEDLSLLSVPAEAEKVYKQWISKDVPNLIADNNLHLKTVEWEESSEHRARLAILLSDDVFWTDLPFTVLLIKEDNWKIIGVTSSDRSEDFMTRRSDHIRF